MDSYEKYGTFPISMLSGTEGGSINESIRCHHRPRSIFPLLCFSIWTYFSLPLMYSTTKWLLGDGVTSIIAGLFIFGISNNFLKYLVLFRIVIRMLTELIFIHHSFTYLLFSAALFIYKLISITLISRGSSYGTKAQKCKQ